MGSAILDLWLLGQALSLPLTKVVFRTPLLDLTTLRNFRGESFWGIFQPVPRFCPVAVSLSVPATFRDTPIRIGLDKTGDVPVARLNEAGLVTFQEGTF